MGLVRSDWRRWMACGTFCASSGRGIVLLSAFGANEGPWNGAKDAACWTREVGALLLGGKHHFPQVVDHVGVELVGLVTHEFLVGAAGKQMRHAGRSQLARGQ